MPSFNIHLAVAIKYCEKYKIDDEKSFFEGSVYPDLVKDKKITHYTKPRDKNNLKEYLLRKVDLEAYLNNNEIKNDFDRGFFLHLLTDKIFFDSFFDEEYVNNTKFSEFIKCLYYSYDKTNRYLEEKYGITSDRIGQTLMNRIRYVPEKKEVLKNILPLEKLDKFIENVAKINIEEYIRSIK